jgi:hypothetical protein
MVSKLTWHRVIGATERPLAMVCRCGRALRGEEGERLVCCGQVYYTPVFAEAVERQCHVESLYNNTSRKYLGATTQAANHRIKIRWNNSRNSPASEPESHCVRREDAHVTR